MKAYVLGNPGADNDSLPVRLISDFRKAFPDIEFIETDPTENFEPEEGSVIIDTVEGLTECRWFDYLDAFQQSAHVSVHDYDLYLHLKLLQKLGKLPAVRIFGIPAKENGKLEKITDAFGSGIWFH